MLEVLRYHNGNPDIGYIATHLETTIKVCPKEYGAGQLLYRVLVT